MIARSSLGDNFLGLPLLNVRLSSTAAPIRFFACRLIVVTGMFGYLLQISENGNFRSWNRYARWTDTPKGTLEYLVFGFMIIVMYAYCCSCLFCSTCVYKKERLFICSIKSDNIKYIIQIQKCKFLWLKQRKYSLLVRKHICPSIISLNTDFLWRKCVGIGLNILFSIKYNHFAFWIS